MIEYKDIFGNPIRPSRGPRSAPNKHPAYGYATVEQIEELQRLRYGADYDQLWKTIEEQHKRKGKPK